MKIEPAWLFLMAFGSSTFLLTALVAAVRKKWFYFWASILLMMITFGYSLMLIGVNLSAGK